MAVSDSFARVLAAGRPQFNARVAEAKRRTPGFAAEEFAAFLESGVDGVVAAVDAVVPARTAAVAVAAFEVALALAAHGLAGPASRCPLVSRLWVELFPRLAPRIAEAPAEVLGALSNAAVQLSGQAGVRSGEWLALMADLAPRAASVGPLLDVGKVLAWRCGAAHFRAGALAAGDALPAGLALAAVGAPGHGAWPEVRAAFRADAWWSPGAQGGKSREVGGFAGFGGAFAQPPELRVAPDGFWVRSGERHSLVVADAWGAVLLPATAQEFGASPHPSRAAAPVHRGNRLVFEHRTVDLDLPGEGLQLLANADTAAVASPYSHVIRLFALR
ncbi:MAG TPA: hypothetical protein VNB23_02990 [Ramlibacter sp.]|nr:hypothetical protein [Ramlibacter sp.]